MSKRLNSIDLLCWQHAIINNNREEVFQNMKEMGMYIKDKLDGKKGYLFFEYPERFYKEYLNITPDLLFNELVKGNSNVTRGIFHEKVDIYDILFENTEETCVEKDRELFNELTNVNLEVYCVYPLIEMDKIKQRILLRVLNEMIFENIKKRVKKNNFDADALFFSILGADHEMGMSYRLEKIFENVNIIRHKDIKEYLNQNFS